jgi:hypothetical protein
VISNTPDCVARWLRATLEIRPPGHPDRPVLERLAGDERMAGLWDPNEVGDLPWQAQVTLIECAFHFAQRTMLAALLVNASDRHFELAAAQTALWAAARMLIRAIEDYPHEAVRLWTGLPAVYDPATLDAASLNELSTQLRPVAGQAEAEADAVRNALADLPPPDRRGPGNPAQMAYRQALAAALTKEHFRELSQTRRDRIIALLASVVFDREIDADSISRARQRQKTRRDKSA